MHCLKGWWYNFVLCVQTVRTVVNIRYIVLVVGEINCMSLNFIPPTFNACPQVPYTY